MKSSEPDPWLVSAGQWPVEGISPLYHRWVVPPSNQHALDPEGMLLIVLRLLQSSSKAE